MFCSFCLKNWLEIVLKCVLKWNWGMLSVFQCALWDKYGEKTYRTIFSHNHRLWLYVWRDTLKSWTFRKKGHIFNYLLSPTKPPKFSQQDRDPNIRYTCTTLWCNVKLLLLPQLFALCGKPFCFSYASFCHSITERSFISKS